MNFHLLPKVLPRNDNQRRVEFERRLMQREAEIGGKLFGPIPAGHKRSFFCLDEHTWIWHEEWLANGRRQVVTTRYDVRPTGVIKWQDGKAAQQLSDNEAVNLYDAVELYRKRVHTEYQRLLETA
jgi:hypothetical protein